MGVLGVGPKGFDKDLPQGAFVVECEDEALARPIVRRPLSEPLDFVKPSMMS